MSCCNSNIIHDNLWIKKVINKKLIAQYITLNYLNDNLKKHENLVESACSNQYNVILIGASLIEFLQYTKVNNFSLLIIIAIINRFVFFDNLAVMGRRISTYEDLEYGHWW
jgi:hypothetical protein